MRKILIIIVAFLFVGCSGSKKRQHNTELFDLEKYFSTEITRLQNINQGIQKDINTNKKFSSLAIAKPDWNTEFEVFINSNINKHSMLDYYNVIKTDSTETYIATDESMKTKTLLVKKLGDSIVSIIVENKTKNILYSLSEYLVYKPNKSIEIMRIQKTIFLKEERTGIKTRFL